MKTHEIRHKFLNYFKTKGHAIVPSSPVIPHDDPTLLFTNAGMNQFKDVFLGATERDYKRAATSQKCIRAGGKHNDLENVGHTRRHLTFFEMLGNFSFGDYFKEDAIRFAWEVSTEVFGFEPERIFPTIFIDDDEAFEIWKKYVPEKRITRFGEKQNFWAMGDIGPCGPCSELLYDRGHKFGTAANPLEDVQEERFLEFWNLVFMQYNKREDGSLIVLPKPSIDTGAGLERICDLKMGAETVYDTDVLRELIAEVENISKIAYHPDAKNAAAFRVIADHLRCLAFAIADGAQPSNIERGYVLRKILRRAVRYGKSLNFEEPFLAKILPRLISTMGEDFIELKKAELRIAEILTSEEEAFFRTLKRGGNLLNEVIQEAKKHQGQISGDEAFKLKDTYGLPLEEILLIAKDGDLSVDLKRYQELDEQAKERSRQTTKEHKQTASVSLFEGMEETEFTGYAHTEGESTVVKLVVDNQPVDQMKEGQSGLVLLKSTPFYAEKGGQVGDTGSLQGPEQWFSVTDTQSPYKGVIAHVGKLEKGTLKIGDRLEALIECERRQLIANNHTATHLLHYALIHVLGEHVKQAGSVVDPERLRFDFSHHKSMTPEEILEVEDLVNTKIRENIAVDFYELSYEEAQKKQEIKQFFGDKYGAKVRVIDMRFSKELCGGTHTDRTGNIGFFRIVKESSIAQGVRRIEAVTGRLAIEFSRQSDHMLESLAAQLKTKPHLLLTRTEKLLEENQALALQLKEVKKEETKALVTTLQQRQETINNIPFITALVDLGAEELKEVADALILKMGHGVLVLGAPQQDRCQILARVSPDLIEKGIRADQIIKKIASIVEGGGGGKSDSAQAGGKRPDKLKDALDQVRLLLS